MNKFTVIEKDSLNKATFDTAHFSLSEASIIHTKMNRDDVAEFIRDGNNLVLKLKNGETIVIENFFITYDEVSSDLVFEEDGCVLYWFDEVSGFKTISGLEVLLPEASSQLMGLLPWLIGAGAIGGAIAATNNDDHKNPSKPNGTLSVELTKTGMITGGTTDVAPGSEVKLTITGQDQSGNPIEREVTATVQPDGRYTAEVPADFADGELTVKAETVDRNGTPVEAEDSLVKTDHDNDPNTPDQGGLDREAGSITVDVDNSGNITGGTTDVAPGSEVKLTITGQDQSGNPIEREFTATVQPDGRYTAEVPADFADGELTVKAETVDRNGTPVEAEDNLEKTDHDNDPNTPDQGGLDRVDGSITVDVDNAGNISGGTTDVAPGSEVTLTITGQDQSGNPIEREVTATVQPDGRYTAEVPADFADGELTVKAETVDRNGTPVEAEDSLVKTDHDNDPNTPDQGGLDRVDGSITVDVDNAGNISGGTTDVAPGSEVTLTITGQDQSGNPIEREVTATVQPDGRYTAEVPADFA
ncbi:BapA prefix-like domain-containing protein, partial [Acinetobacter baumannii]|nr:BapA prefix-like domain-containing protein [Acinetobacter baumannii]